MSIFKFTYNILKNKKIDIFNKGKHERDFTYVDDVSFSILKIVNSNFKNNFNIYNIGNSNPQNLLKLIKILEKILKKKAKKIYIEIQTGDVEKTSSNSLLLSNKIKFKPKTKIEDGLKKFVTWFKDYYKIR